MLKRAIDLVVTIVALVLLAPLFLLIGIAVRLDSAGPVLYSQVRIGRGGRPFRLHKFRSMVAGADKLGPPLTALQDWRITRVGRLLRRTRLDELPQLVNVLKGDMSLVGPRPEVPEIVQRYTAEQRRVLEVRPGLIGPTQLAWLDEAEQYPRGVDRMEYYVRHILPRKLARDLEYVQTRTTLTDLLHLVSLPLTLGARWWKRPRLVGLARRGTRLLMDCACVLAANIIAFSLRFDWRIPPEEVANLRGGLLVAFLAYLTAFMALRTYRAIWEHVSIEDLWRLIRSAGVGAGLHALGMWVAGWRSYPRSIVPATGVLVILLLGGMRVIARSAAGLRRSGGRRAVRGTIIVGTGEAGEVVAREVSANPACGYEIVGFVDDDPGRTGDTIHSLPVLGTIADLPMLARTYRVQEALIVSPALAGRRLRRFAQLCVVAGLEFRTLPSMRELVRGEGNLRYLREVDVNDLLSREAAPIDERTVGAFLRGKRVMVTGAGGSIGSELCRQVVRLGADSLVMVERAENSLHDISVAMRTEFPSARTIAALADVKHVPRMTELFQRFSPHLVFHAAAYKHVPILEAHPGEAVLNNVVGTRRLADVANRFGVEDFILISSDKAVKPSSLMGATKRICELYMTALNRASDSLNGCKLRTRYVVVRFGNVLGSSGSVIPVFRRQIETGNPITVTDPDASRFFMTITEAVGLVLVSASMRGQGEIFVLDMGEPVRIGDLVDNLAMSMGVSPGEVDRRYIGLRPGEKMHEVLWQEGEALIPSAHQGIFTLRQEAAGSLTEVAALLDELEVLAIRGDVCRLLRRVQEAVPSYQPPIKVRRFEVSEAGEKYRILIVDDDQAFRAVMGEALEGTYQVETASTAEGALAKAEKFRPHLVLLDMSLPDVNGVEVCHRLRADRKLGGVGIILVTGYTDVNTVETGLRAGADDYLAKPFSVNELRARIEAVLRRAERLTGAFGWV